MHVFLLQVVLVSLAVFVVVLTVLFSIMGKASEDKKKGPVTLQDPMTKYPLPLISKQVSCRGNPTWRFLNQHRHCFLSFHLYCKGKEFLNTEIRVFSLHFGFFSVILNLFLKANLVSKFSTREVCICKRTSLFIWGSELNLAMANHLCIYSMYLIFCCTLWQLCRSYTFDDTAFCALSTNGKWLRREKYRINTQTACHILLQATASVNLTDLNFKNVLLWDWVIEPTLNKWTVTSRDGVFYFSFFVLCPCAGNQSRHKEISLWPSVCVSCPWTASG